jgi:hypothetical protein
MKIGLRGSTFLAVVDRLSLILQMNGRNIPFVNSVKYCHVYGGTREEMTSSISEDWILLVLPLQPPLITLNNYTNAILHTSNIAVLQHM